MEKFKFLEHTADIKFQAFGKNFEEVFTNCAYAMTESMLNKKVKARRLIKFNIRGNDLENLLYNFLEEFLFLFDSEKIILSKFKKIKIDEKKFGLECEFYGDSSENYVFDTHIKAITYNEMFIKKQGNKFIAQVVLDV